MKKSFGSILIVLLVAACAADLSYAQQGGRQGRGFGRGRGGNSAELICDALVLKADRAEKVTQAYEEARSEMREGFTGGDFQSMSQEERRAAFQKMRETMQASLTKKLAAILTADELEGVKPLLATPFGRTVPEIRALRQIEIGDQERGKLQTVVLIYMNTMVSLRPPREPGQFQRRPRGEGGQPGQGGPRGGNVSEETRAKMEKARTTLLADIKKILNDEQEKAWVAQSEKVQQELESQRQNRGQGQGQGRRQRQQ